MGIGFSFHSSNFSQSKGLMVSLSGSIEDKRERVIMITLTINTMLYVAVMSSRVIEKKGNNKQAIIRYGVLIDYCYLKCARISCSV